MRQHTQAVFVASLLCCSIPACGRIGFDDLTSSAARSGGNGNETSLPSSPDGGGGLNASNGGTDGGGGDRSSASGAGGSTAGSTSTLDGGSRDSGSDAASVGVLLVIPGSVGVLTNATVKFVADGPISGSDVNWTVREGTSGGSVDANGLYTAPAAPGVYHVVATSQADSRVAGVATVTVTSPASDTVGTWTSVTAASINLDPTYRTNQYSGSNYGAQEVVVDPVRPSDVYAFVCYQGVFRSTDYGQTWIPISTGKNVTVLNTGRPWTAAIDPNPDRDPATPPTLYTANGYGTEHGILKSTNGGVDWLQYPFPSETGQDVAAIDIDPYDGEHLLAGFQDNHTFAESKDGAQTWTPILTLPASLTGVHPFFVKTGKVATSRKTWLAISHGGGTVDGSGMYRTEDGGATWKQVSLMGYNSGSNLIFQAGSGLIYAAGQHGTVPGPNAAVYKSTDYGVSWDVLVAGTSTGIVGTPTFLYANTNLPETSGGPTEIKRAPRTTETPWTDIPAPPEMTNGAKNSVVTYDGTHYVIVSANWNAGLWRYVEP